MNDDELRKAMQERKVTEAIGDPEFSDIGELPSKFLPYKFNTLKMRSFRLPELRLIAKAHQHKDIYFVVRAVNNVIDVDVHELTIPDFIYILYRLRIDSYPKTPLYMPWKCDEELPVVVEGKKHKTKTRECGHENLTPLMKSNMQVIYLDDCEGWENELPEYLDHPRVSVLASIDHKEPEDADHHLISVARWVKHGETIDEKIAFLEGQPDLDIWEDAIEVSGRLTYGVREGAKVKCEECGADRYYKVSVSPATFLP